MFSGHVCLIDDVYPGQEFIDAAVGMIADDPGKYITQIGVRVDVVEFTGLDQGRDDGPVFTAAVGAGEEGVLSVKRDRPD